MSDLRLRAELALHRAGWPALAGLALLIAGLLAHLWWLPQQQGRIARMEAEYRRLAADFNRPASAQPAQDAATLLARRQSAFEATLAPRSSVPDLIKTVFGEAGKAGLTLSQAEYRLGEDKAGGYSSYQMILPVHGPYPKLRGFAESVLAAIPAAALEEVSFKREAIGNPATEARLRLVFYLKDAAP